MSSDKVLCAKQCALLQADKSYLDGMVYVYQTLIRYMPKGGTAKQKLEIPIADITGEVGKQRCSTPRQQCSERSSTLLGEQCQRINHTPSSADQQLEQPRSKHAVRSSGINALPLQAASSPSQTRCSSWRAAKSAQCCGSRASRTATTSSQPTPKLKPSSRQRHKQQHSQHQQQQHRQRPLLQHLAATLHLSYLRKWTLKSAKNS